MSRENSKMVVYSSVTTDDLISREVSGSGGGGRRASLLRFLEGPLSFRPIAIMFRSGVFARMKP